MHRDIFTPSNLSDFSKPIPGTERSFRARDLKSQQKTYLNQEQDFKKLFEESQRMNTQYLRSSAALDARSSALDALQQPLQSGPTSFLNIGGVATGFQQTGRSLQ